MPAFSSSLTWPQRVQRLLRARCLPEEPRIRLVLLSSPARLGSSPSIFSRAGKSDWRSKQHAGRSPRTKTARSNA